ncbi:MAG: helix-turn-helix domain-containing protein [Acidimicrobiales bacterium]
MAPDDRPSYRIYSPATLASALKDFRIARGLTQAELASAVRGHRQYVSDLERAQFSEQVERILEILERLGVRMTLTLEEA